MADIAVVGLGVMGANLARNLHSRGLTVAVYNRNSTVSEAFMEAHGDARFERITDYAQLAAHLSRPRKVLLMVTAGRAVDAVIDALTPHLDAGDIVIDGGNSHWPDTDRRHATLAAQGLHFVGLGVSGGEEGALLGPSMMPGGDRETWAHLAPLLEPAAATSDTGPCVTWCGHRSAGHAVKMVHNGIEYGDMQLISEVWSLLHDGLGLSHAETAATFAQWNTGRLESYLVEIAATVAGAQDPETGDALLDHILDVAGQKGTGRWTALDAVESGVAIPTIAAAVDARVLSARRDDRLRASAVFGDTLARLEGVTTDDLASALYAAKLMSYTQGFDLIRTASDDRAYATNLAEVARIWKGGCIIRAAFLDRVHAAFSQDPDLPLLCLDATFSAELIDALPAWRRVVGAATAAGFPIPALSASLAYFDTLRRGRGTACVIQGLRDLFGAHTYRRVSAPDVAVHSEWGALPRLG